MIDSRVEADSTMNGDVINERDLSLYVKHRTGHTVPVLDINDTSLIHLFVETARSV
jgi:hypothetical protein